MKIIRKRTQLPTTQNVDLKPGDTPQSLVAERDTIRNQITALRTERAIYWRKVRGVLLGGGLAFVTTLILFALTKSAAFGFVGMCVFVVGVFALQRATLHDPDKALLETNLKLDEVQYKLFALDALSASEKSEVVAQIHANAAIASTSALQWSIVGSIVLLSIGSLLAAIFIMYLGSGEPPVGTAVCGGLALLGGVLLTRKAVTLWRKSRTGMRTTA